MNIDIPSHRDIFMIAFLVQEGWVVNPNDNKDLYYPPEKDGRGNTLREAYGEALRRKQESSKKRSKK